jgi:hypothetical protein
MNSSSLCPRLWAFASLALLAGFTSSAWAVTTVATVPVGYLKLDVAGGGATTPVGIALDDLSAPPAGIRAGRIESFTSNSLADSQGGWSTNLATASAPWTVRITSGPAAGKTLDLTGNTMTTLSVSGVDLTSLGLTAGVDTFELVPLDTLWTLLGSDTVQGGTSAATADNVQVRSGASWLAYYFDTNLGYWRRTIGPATNSNNVVIRPGTGIQIVRRSAALSLTFTGRVPATAFRMAINNASTTALHTGFPTDTTLGALAVQTLLPGWRNGTDLLGLSNSSVGYVFNGSFWQPASGPATNSDALAIPAGSLLIIQRPGATSGTTDLIRPLPYSL